MTAQTTEPPRAAIEPAGYQPGPDPGRWRVSWRIRNQGTAALQLLDAHIPHHRFHAGHQPLAGALPPGDSTRIELDITHGAQTGDIIDNAFLIVRVAQAGMEWRVFARLRVTIGPDGEPDNTCQVTLTQPVGVAEREMR